MCPPSNHCLNLPPSPSPTHPLISVPRQRPERREIKRHALLLGRRHAAPTRLVLKNINTSSLKVLNKWPPSPQLSPYELARLERIKANLAEIARIGLAPLAPTADSSGAVAAAAAAAAAAKAAAKDRQRQARDRREASAPLAGSRTSKRLRRQNPDGAPEPESEPEELEEELAAVDYDREWPVSACCTAIACTEIELCTARFL